MKHRAAVSLSRDSSGATAIEFAFLVLPLSLALLGIVDLGLGFWKQMEVVNAADAGANYVMANGYSSTKVTQAVQNATSLGAGVSVPTPTTVCGCPTASAVTTVTGTGNTYPTCGGSCSSVTGSLTTTSLPYATITATYTYTTIFPWFGGSRSVTLSASAIAEN